MTPQRWQRSRLPGARQPASCRYCGRGTKYGNDYEIQKQATQYGMMVEREYALTKFRQQMADNLKHDPAYYDDLLNYDFISCFCPLSLPCHCDPIIEHLKERIKELELIP